MNWNKIYMTNTEETSQDLHVRCKQYYISHLHSVIACITSISLWWELRLSCAMMQHAIIIVQLARPTNLVLSYGDVTHSPNQCPNIHSDKQKLNTTHTSRVYLELCKHISFGEPSATFSAHFPWNLIQHLPIIRE